MPNHPTQTKKSVHRVRFLGLVCLTFGLAVPAPAACFRSCVYIIDSNGREQTVCQTSGSGSSCDESRWDCRFSGTCNPCGFCHKADRTYTAKAPKVHAAEFPKFEMRLTTGQKIAWGDGGALVAEKDGTLTEVDAAGKPLRKFPSGSMLLRSASGTTAELTFLKDPPVTLSGTTR